MQTIEKCPFCKSSCIVGEFYGPIFAVLCDNPSTTCACSYNGPQKLTRSEAVEVHNNVASAVRDRDELRLELARSRNAAPI